MRRGAGGQGGRGAGEQGSRGEVYTSIFPFAPLLTTMQSWCDRVLGEFGVV
ncbi:hypothetical protein JYQ62_30765 [Nostoc sp. UHCC 0702]|nr:hypothetical protein JYQ62_30765 [Nostoc sp. UHCC 0702]